MFLVKSKSILILGDSEHEDNILANWINRYWPHAPSSNSDMEEIKNPNPPKPKPTVVLDTSKPAVIDWNRSFVVCCFNSHV